MFVGLALWLGCQSDPPRPDVFLFTVDTLRADHLSVYGYGRPTSPWLDRVAPDAVVFDAAAATASWTVPSIGSMLTGLLPHQLGIERAPSIPTAGEARPVLPAAAITLAERLKAAGYETWAVTANAQLALDLGYGQGFDHYVNLEFAPADAVIREVDALSAAVRAHRGPVFVWVHLFDPHDPYVAHDPWSRDWARGPPTGVEGLVIRDLRERMDLTTGGAPWNELVALYDAEVAYADQALSHIEGALGVGREDVLVFAADHGEELGDHHNFGHRLNLYEETLRVPLLVRWVGHFPPRRVPERVSLGWLSSTLAAVAGAPVGPDPGFPSATLLPWLEGGHAEAATPVVAEMFRANGRYWAHALFRGTEKLVVHEMPEHRLLLFDLATDPKERDNLAGGVGGDRPPAQQGDHAAALEHDLEEALGAWPLLKPERTKEAAPDLQRQLEAMGYVDPETAR